MDGTWNIEMESPLGRKEASLDIAIQGDALTGMMRSDDLGEAEMENGRVDGNAVSWTADISEPMPIALEFDGTATGDTMSGEVKMGAFGVFPFTATKV